TLKAALATLLRSGGEVQPVSPLFVQRAPLEPVASFERTAQARQPQIARLRAMVAQAEQGVRVQQAKLKPQIFAFGQYDFRRRDEMLTDPDWA
ncbi:TolC family protein, partial [bacterium M00.F.Ca.ET.229.01.1.1]